MGEVGVVGGGVDGEVFVVEIDNGGEELVGFFLFVIFFRGVKMKG